MNPVNPSLSDSPSEEEISMGIELAWAFHSWQTLNKQLESDPQRVPPEQMAAAWDKLMEAYERWTNSR